MREKLKPHFTWLLSPRVRAPSSKRLHRDKLVIPKMHSKAMPFFTGTVHPATGSHGK